jgi:hypothetical protein
MCREVQWPRMNVARGGVEDEVAIVLEKEEQMLAREMFHVLFMR